MANKKLKNVSTRIFQIPDGAGASRDIKPGQLFEIDAAGAAHLMGLYPRELIDAEAELKALAEAAASAPAAPVVDNVEAMKVPELKAALKAKGVEFPAAASKADLVALLKGASGEAAPVAPTGPAVPTTPLTGPEMALEAGVVYQDDLGMYVGTATTVDGVTKVGLLPVASLTPEQRATLVAEGKLTA